MEKKWEVFLGTVSTCLQPGKRSLCFERLLSRPVSPWEGWSETVCKKKGGKQRQEQSAFPGPGAGRESWNPVGCATAVSRSRASTAGWRAGEGRVPSSWFSGSITVFTKLLKTGVCP